ncbi:MAG: adenosylcobinamide-phosphate synthase CbiB [Intestinibacillus sp.]
MYLIFAVLLGFLLDCAFGDPKWLPHPVCAIGRLISLTEKSLRMVFPRTPRGETVAGVLLWLTVCSLSFVVPCGILWWLQRENFWLAFAVETVLCYQVFARKSLANAGASVEKSLSVSLEEGRKAVAMYVGRDTGELDETGVIKATVETIAENLNDGVIAPMVFLLIGGAPLGLLYKAVNTLDSMVGYHNEKYEYFGKFSARMDDIWGFIPARLSAMCLIAGTGLLGYDSRNALRVFLRDRMKHKSPNAGQTEAACAGALHVQLAGDACYFGKAVHKEPLGDPDRKVITADIGRTVDLMTAASILALLLCCAVRLALTWPAHG